MMNELFTGIRERLTGRYSTCLRAFDFEGDCTDEEGNSDGTPTDLLYTVGKFGIRQAAYFDGLTSIVNCGSEADIDTLGNFTVICFVYPVEKGILYEKVTGGNGVTFSLQDGGGGTFKLYGKVSCSTSAAESTSSTTIAAQTWTMVAMVWNGTTKTISLFTGKKDSNGRWKEAEVSYSPQTVGVGSQSSDAAGNALIGNDSGGADPFKGGLDTFRLYSAALSVARMGWFIEVPSFPGVAVSPFPYITFEQVAGNPDWTFDHDREMPLIQFSMFAEGNASMSAREELGHIEDGVKRCFDLRTIALNGYSNIICRREGETGPLFIDRVYQKTVDYMIELQQEV